MAVERVPGGTSLIDVLDRVLDKGIVIDAWVRVARVGISLSPVGALIVVSSFDTHLEHSDAVGSAAPASQPVEANPAKPRVEEPAPFMKPPGDDGDEDDGPAGSGARAGAAVIVPRALPLRYRRPID